MATGSPASPNAHSCEELLFKNKCISPLFNQVGKLGTSSHLQLRPGQDKAKQFDTYNNTHGVKQTYSQ
jgi:hypothetical protein